MKTSSFVGGSIDSCLYVKKSTNDNLMIGNISAINDAIEALKNKELPLKIVKGLQDYLSHKIKFSNNKKCAWLGQPYLIKNLENIFQRLVNEVWSHKTPGTPKFFVIWPMEKNEKIPAKDQSHY